MDQVFVVCRLHQQKWSEPHQPAHKVVFSKFRPLFRWSPFHANGLCAPAEKKVVAGSDQEFPRLDRGFVVPDHRLRRVIRRPIPFPINGGSDTVQTGENTYFQYFKTIKEPVPTGSDHFPGWFHASLKSCPRAIRIPRCTRKPGPSAQVHPLVFPSSPGSAKKHPPPPHRCATRGGGPRAPGGRFSWHMDLFSLSWSMA